MSGPQERARIAQAELWAAQEAVRQAEVDAKCGAIAETVAEHERVNRRGDRATSPGPRPPQASRQEYDLDPPYCDGCPPNRDWDPPFPCKTYELARDWSE